MINLKNKKGDVSDYFTFLILVFFLAISFLVVSFANNEISNVIKTTALNDTSVAQSATDQIDSWVSTITQRGFVMIVAFLIIGMMVSSFMIRIHPIFFFLYLIFLGIAIFVAVPLANSYQMVMEAEALSSIASQQTMTNWIMQHLVLIMLAAGALSMIITFGKLFGSRGGYEGGQL